MTTTSIAVDALFGPHSAAYVGSLDDTSRAVISAQAFTAVDARSAFKADGKERPFALAMNDVASALTRTVLVDVNDTFEASQELSVQIHALQLQAGGGKPGTAADDLNSAITAKAAEQQILTNRRTLLDAVRNEVLQTMQREFGSAVDQTGLLTPAQIAAMPS